MRVSPTGGHLRELQSVNRRGWGPPLSEVCILPATPQTRGSNSSLLIELGQSVAGINLGSPPAIVLAHFLAVEIRTVFKRPPK